MGLLMAGCVSVPAPGSDGAGRGESGVTLTLPQFVPSVAISKDWPGAEPVIAVASDGTLFAEGIGTVVLQNGQTTNVNKGWRSTDGGKTWTDITPPGLGQERSNDGFIAVGNGDRVYLVNVASLTFEMYRSEDKGATRILLATPKLPALMHRNWIVPSGPNTIHVVMEALPPTFAPFLAGQSPPENAPSTANEGLWYMRSDDTGQTWTTPVQIDPTVNFAGQGNLAMSRDGQFLAVPRYSDDVKGFSPTYLGGKWYMMVSENAGRNWERREMFRLTSELASAVEPLAMDAEGTLYFVWSQQIDGTSLLHMSVSKDRAKTWGGPMVIARGNVTQSMPWINVRMPGELGVAWYEAPVVGPASKVNASWHFNYGLLSEADTAAPVMHAARATTEPVHEGNICARGPACGSGEDRRLLDYPWLEFGPDGRAHMVLASTKWEKRSAFAVYAGESTRLTLD